MEPRGGELAPLLVQESFGCKRICQKGVTILEGYSNMYQKSNFEFGQLFEAEVIKEIKLNKNEVFLLSEYVAYNIYLKKGRVKVVVSNEEGLEKLLFYVEENGFVLMSTGEYLTADLMATLVADVQTILYCIPVEEFKQALAVEEIRDIYLDSVIRKSNYLIKHTFDLTFSTSRSRLYHILLDLANDYGQANAQGHILIEKLPTRGDLALITGVHRTNIATYLTELENQGIISRDRRNIILNDKSELKALIEEELSKGF